MHTAILTLKEGFEGQMTEDNIEIGICNDAGFRYVRTLLKCRPVRSLCKVGVDTVHCCSRLYNECTADWHGSVLSRSHMILPEPDPKIYRDLNSDLVFSGKKNEEKFKEELTNPKILPQNLSNAIIINFTQPKKFIFCLFINNKKAV